MLNMLSMFFLASVFHFQPESSYQSEWQIGTAFGRATVNVSIFYDRPAENPDGSAVERFYLDRSHFQMGSERITLRCARVLGSSISNDHLITSVVAYPDLSACDDEEKFRAQEHANFISYRISSERPGEMLGLQIRYLHNDFRAVPMSQ